jgi:hypothetical protein
MPSAAGPQAPQEQPMQEEEQMPSKFEVQAKELEFV